MLFPSPPRSLAEKKRDFNQWATEIFTLMMYVRNGSISQYILLESSWRFELTPLPVLFSSLNHLLDSLSFCAQVKA